MGIEMILDLIVIGCFTYCIPALMIVWFRQQKTLRLIKRSDYDLEVLARLTRMEAILDNDYPFGAVCVTAKEDENS